ncbi:Gem-associated protein 5 [Triplophysa tibetana]|uniref:Gem-associated protein 5 n=1 Tax=Triplophysa tibetana TaxID=1572043 RepID=A0A5A9PEW6_9TELE|nr:Gem-associated protein 5 [Triplophysa tibetana]
MHERLLPASPNWYCSRCSDVNVNGILGFGAKNVIHLVKVTATSPAATGELIGHTERVSGFAFCHHDGQENICASTSDDRAVKIWDAEQRVLVTEHNVHQNTISAVHWSAVQKHLVVTGDEKGVVVCFRYSSNDTQSFFPEPRTIFCLSCSPHDENYIAVGYKDGMIVVIDISKKGDVIHRLRGHDDEIHALAWCPQPREEPLYGRFSEENTDGSNGLTEGAEAGCYLASGSRDQTVRIWSTARGKGVMTLKLPFLKRRGAGVDPTVKERLWLTVHWPKGRSSQIVSSCFGGEIAMWDLMKSGKQKWTLLGSSSDGQNHGRIVFNMSSCSLGERELLLSTSMDREIKCWDLASLECCWTLPTLGGFVYCLSFSSVSTGSLALGVGDSMIRVWNTLSIQNKYDIRTFWQGIKSKVTALAWHPLKEGSLAFGTDDGKVGIYEVYSNKPPQVSSTYHRRTVYTLSWGPPVPPVSFGGSEDKPSYSLYSCAGEGVIFQHNPWKLSGEASNIDKLIRDTNNIKHKMAPHTDLCWKPDGSVLAIGNEDGSIDVFEAPTLKLLCSVQQHHKIINALCWHHEHSAQSDLQYLLASGSSSATVYIHDLRSAIETPSESSGLVTEPYRTLSGHTNKITGLSWSPHHDGPLNTVLVSSSSATSDVSRHTPQNKVRDHSYLLIWVRNVERRPSVRWSREKDVDTEERSQFRNLFVRIRESRAPSFLLARRWITDQKMSFRRTVSHWLQSDIHTVSAGYESLSMTLCAHYIDLVGIAGNAHKNIRSVCAVGEKNPSFRKAVTHIPTKFFAINATLLHGPFHSLFMHNLCLVHVIKHKDCIHYFRSQAEMCVPGAGDHIQLGLFTDRDALYRMFQEEEESHVDAGHYDSVMYLRLWKGDLTGALNVATEKGELNDHLLSLAPMAGYQVWFRTVEAYVRQLCLHEQFLKAASHLISIHKIYEAISLLKGHQFYREAIALAKARLQPEDPVQRDLYMSWATVLEKDGHYATAAKCYLAADSSFDAAKVIAKKGDVTSLRTAANLAWLSGESELAHSLSLRCAKDLMLSQDWLATQEVLKAQDSLLVCFKLFLKCTYADGVHLKKLKQIAKLLSEFMSSLLSTTAYNLYTFLCLDERMERCIKNVMYRISCVSHHSASKGKGSQAAVLIPPVAASVPMKQLLSFISLDVTLCALSQLSCDWPSVLEELLRAVTRGFEVGRFTLMSEMSHLLLPQGLDSVAFYKRKLCPADEKSLAVSRNMEAFVCYQLLYKKWWSHGTQTSTSTDNMTSNGHHSTEQKQSEDADRNGEVQSEGFWKVLLCEPHASFQAIQRAIAEIQSEVLSLVQRHNPSTDSNLSSDNATETSSDTHLSEEQEGANSEKSQSFATLTARAAEYHKELAAVPEMIKKYPFPDVMECCIVLLYLDQHFAPIPQHISSEATALLHKYGSTASLHKAWQRLTH